MQQSFSEIPRIRQNAQGQHELYGPTAARSTEEEAEEMDSDEPLAPSELLDLAERDLALRRAQYEQEAQQLAAQERLLAEQSPCDAGDLDQQLHTLSRRRARLETKRIARVEARPLVDRCVALGTDSLPTPQRQALLRPLNAHRLLAMAMARQLTICSALLDERYCVLVVRDALRQRVVAYVAVHVDTLYLEK